METNRRKLQLKAFEFLDRHLTSEIKKTLDSSQMDEILRCIVNWIYADRNEINLCVLLDITAYIAKRKKDDPRTELDDHPDFLSDLKKL